MTRALTKIMSEKMVQLLKSALFQRIASSIEDRSL